MRFMDSRALSLQQQTGPQLEADLQAAIGEMEQHLRQQAIDARQAVVRWSVNVEYRMRDHSGEIVLVPPAHAQTAHVTVLLVTARQA